MRRLADIFSVDVASIHSMWLLHGVPNQKERFQREALPLVEDALSHVCNTLVADYYEGDLVIFMDWTEEGAGPLGIAEALCRQLESAGLDAVLITCQDLPTTADVRRAYLTIRGSHDDALRIWPGRRRYTLQEMEFAHTCRETIGQGEGAVRQTLAPLDTLRAHREGTELARTLAVYLLDAACSVTQTAQLLYLHKNTVKYRLQQINGRLGYPAGKLPEIFSLYTACAVGRMLGD